MWASCWCHILDSEIVRDFRMALVLAVEGALGVEEAGGFVDTIVGSAICTLWLTLFLLFPFLVVDKSVVVGTMVYMLLISFPARMQEDGKVVVHVSAWNIVVHPGKIQLVDQ